MHYCCLLEQSGKLDVCLWTEKVREEEGERAESRKRKRVSSPRPKTKHVDKEKEIDEMTRELSDSLQST